MRQVTFTEKGIISDLKGRSYTKALKSLYSDFVDKNSPSSHSWLGEFINAEASLTMLTKITSDFPQLVNQADREGHTPLFYAAKAHNIDAVRLITSKGVDINTLFAHHGTVLHIAARKNNQLFIVNLVEEGADFSIANLRGETADDISRRWSCYENIEIFDHLIETPHLPFKLIVREDVKPEIVEHEVESSLEF